MSPAEKAIREARLAVEDMGADLLLTDAVVLLSQAQDKVADFVDRHCDCEPTDHQRGPDCPAWCAAEIGETGGNRTHDVA